MARSARMTHLAWTSAPEPLAAALARPPGRETSLLWLGQAGFAIEIAGLRIIVDPYLSNSLAREFAGHRFSHERMMPAPVAPSDIGHVDLLLSTHSHGDHLDPDTLRPILAARPGLRLAAPEAIRSLALEKCGIGPDRFVGLDAGNAFSPAPGVTITATRAAHETLDRDANGHYVFLGYVIAGPDGAIWHSGDCVPFDGLIEEVMALEPDVALLPVNGRRPQLTAEGILGNFSASEAIAVAEDVGCTSLLMHHYGLFAFNTVPAEQLDALDAPPGLTLRRARLAERYRLVP